MSETYSKIEHVLRIYAFEREDKIINLLGECNNRDLLLFINMAEKGGFRPEKVLSTVQGVLHHKHMLEVIENAPKP